jgi:hypothetical protein
MDIKELRIGNWVKIKDEFSDFDLPLETTEFQIEGFNDGSIHGEDIHVLFWNIKNKIFGTTCSGSFTHQVEPIPLTEEWLLKFGFIPNPYQDRYEKGIIKFECDKTLGETILWIELAPHIKYVHQLQNLYFALTEEELILNI